MTTTSPTPSAPRSGNASDLPLPLWELVALMVAITGLVALSIDMMLPALDDIAEAFRYEEAGKHFGKICLAY